MVVPDHFRLLSHLLDLSVLQLSSLLRIHYHADFHPALENHRAPPLLFRRHPPQINYPANTVPRLSGVRVKTIQEWYLNDGSTSAKAETSKPPTYPAQVLP